MHGSSSVPQALVDIINKFGGKMPDTKGVPIAQIQEGIRRGVAKINVDTDGRLAITGAIRKVLAESPEKFDPRDYLGPARETLAAVIKQRMIDFGTAGHAADYKPASLANMKKIYSA
jgi:fructose-bisphosphate aldolase class II